jgi:predicted nucleotidyltransferase
MASEFETLLEGMRKAAGALRDAEIPFALAGGLAAYARGGPESDHDVDFILKPDDAARALDVLDEAGFRCEKPPEGWLYKVYDSHDAMIDLIFAPNQTPVEDALLERADELEVYAIRMRVMSATDVLVTKLLALKEHEVDYDSVLEVARALREQVEWDDLRERTAHSPYAKAFFTLAEELEIAPEAA